jgi:hypothetical protein
MFVFLPNRFQQKLCLPFREQTQISAFIVPTDCDLTNLQICRASRGKVVPQDRCLQCFH